MAESKKEEGSFARPEDREGFFLSPSFPSPPFDIDEE